ncbi:UNVERIFIED_CONTAM: hypothetical protein PYX00_009618 [Menopon gallinae]|uniref:ABC transporter domain-containing protein n=1 Tax=Menopon gallinae TaxID=328185 RepID=A0AAW2HBQ9_9NEOP
MTEKCGLELNEVRNESMNNNNQFHVSGVQGKGYAFPKKARIDLEFSDVHFSVMEWSFRKLPVSKEILKGVSGLFKAGELTAIMGPSGAGKSTLLNVLAGYTSRGAKGRICINGKERNPNNTEEFRRFSCYIQQDDYLRMELKVCEAMMYTADLKLGCSMSRQKKKEQIIELLNMLGLSHCWETPTQGLSGGQKKRLSVALELISNPPIIFLDEPTTGLDSSSCSQCVSLLKFLAQQGRTVVCTIHQPSALLFEMFDHLYALSAGQCIYSGKVNRLLPYLEEMNLVCPKYHNPADFLLDVAVGEYGADYNTLVEKAKNHLKTNAEKEVKEIAYENDENTKLMSVNNNNNDFEKMEDESELPVPKIHPANYLVQFWLLFCRRLLMIRRKPGNILVRAAAHLLIALLFGYIYAGVGVKATTVLANYCYLYGSNLFVVYTGKMSVMLLFPLEFYVVTREHFNRWYKLGPYYASMLLFEIPFQILSCYLYLPLSFYLTGQPLEWYRFWYFSIMITISSLAAQGFGFLLGVTTPKKIAVFLGPVLACLLSVFGFCLRLADTPTEFRWLYFISYFRAAFQSSVDSVYGFNRTTLLCEDLYCHFRNPKKFLSEMDMPEVVDIRFNLTLIGVWAIMLHVLTVIIIWYRLNRK